MADFKITQIKEHNFHKEKQRYQKEPGRAEWRKVKVMYKLKTWGRQFLDVSF